MIETDYLIVGGGASAMAFADQILTETRATMVIVDRRHQPGGHWNDAYPFVKLHQPSAFYGVGSLPLGSGLLDSAGPNAGNHQLATGVEVSAYFDGLMRDRFLPSARVTYLPMCEHIGEGRIVSRLSGAEETVVVRRKLVDTTFFNIQVPLRHTPNFQIADGVRLVTPNDLPNVVPPQGRYVILGGGKTAMDVAVWLLRCGADARRIRWIVPRDSWLINRDTVQPGEAFFHRTAGGQALQLEAAAAASSLTDLFDRLERCGNLLRIDPSVRPTMYRGATISPGEVEILRTIKDVVRQGRVRRIAPGEVVLDDGRIEGSPSDLYIDCSAKAFERRGSVPVFQENRITIQAVRANLVSFSASFIAHVEAAYENEAEKNDLCTPIPPTDSDSDWPELMLADLRTARRWAADKGLRQWVAQHRLSGNTGGRSQAAELDTAAQDIIRRLAAARGPAEANLARLAAAPPL